MKGLLTRAVSAALFGEAESKPMRIGIPKESKADEYRVAMVPTGIQALISAGHQVLVAHDAGVGRWHQGYRISGCRSASLSAGGGFYCK